MAKIVRPRKQVLDSRQVPMFTQPIKSIIHRPKGNSVFCNAGYDLGWFNCDWDIELPDGSRIHDVGAQAMLIDENRKALPGQKSAYSLDAIAKWRGVEMKDEKLLREAALDTGTRARTSSGTSPSCPGATSASTPSRTRCSTLLSHESMMPEIDEQELERRVRLEMG
jgi:hypothetical protein